MGLKSVHLLQIHGHLAPQDVTVFGNRVFADIIRLRSYWIKMGFYPIINVLTRRENRDTGPTARTAREDRDMKVEQHVTSEASNA